MSIVDRVRQRAEPGPVCLACGTSARDCTVTYLESGCENWCCEVCRASGANQMHPDRPLDLMLDSAAGICQHLVDISADLERVVAELQETEE